MSLRPPSRANTASSGGPLSAPLTRPPTQRPMSAPLGGKRVMKPANDGMGAGAAMGMGGRFEVPPSTRSSLGRPMVSAKIFPGFKYPKKITASTPGRKKATDSISQYRSLSENVGSIPRRHIPPEELRKIYPTGEDGKPTPMFFTGRSQGEIGSSRADIQEAWEGNGNGERYDPCKSIVYAPPKWQLEDDLVREHFAKERDPNSGKPYSKEQLDALCKKNWYRYLKSEEVIEEKQLDCEPEHEMELDFVYGYNGLLDINVNAHRNLYFTYKGHVLWFSAAVCIIMDVTQVPYKQRFMVAHDDDITSMALHEGMQRNAKGQWTRLAPSGNPGNGENFGSRALVASGQMGKVPKIYVWDVDAPEEPLRELHGHQRAVVAMDFSRDGKKLISVGNDDGHTVIIYDWQKGCQLSNSKGHMAEIHSCVFNPYSPGLEFTTTGNKHVKFWDASKGSGQNGLFGKQGTTQQIYSVTFLPNGQAVTGQKDGSIYLWDGGAVVKVKKGAHARKVKQNQKEVAMPAAILGILSTPLGIVTTGEDSHVRVWDSSTLSKLGEFNIKESFAPEPRPGGVRKRMPGHSLNYMAGKECAAVVQKLGIAVKKSSDGGALLVGTTSGDILCLGMWKVGEQVEIVRNKDPEESRIMGGHAIMVRGLVTAHDGSLFYTCGHDTYVRCWDKEKKDLVFLFDCGIPAVGIDLHPKGNILAIGHVGGVVTTWDLTIRDKVPIQATLRSVNADRVEDVDEVRFSPLPVDEDGNLKPNGKCLYLAAASHDSVIDIYSAVQEPQEPDEQMKAKKDPTYLRTLEMARKVQGGGTLGMTGSVGPGGSSPRGKPARPMTASSSSMTLGSTAGPTKFRMMRRTGVCKGHSSYITHIDFNKEGTLLQSTCGANELLNWIMPKGKQNPQTKDLAGTEWATFTCIYGWAVKSIWDEGMDGTDCNAVDRSKNEKLLVTAEDTGLVKLFRFPAVGGQQRFRSYVGHSSHVMNIRFTNDDKNVISVGGPDRAIFQWKIVNALADSLAAAR